MNPKQGDVFKVLAADGTVAAPGHPFVILAITNGMAVCSNITDAEKDDDVACLLIPLDDPKLLTKRSTFRHQSIEEFPIAALAAAFASRKLLYWGQLSSAAFRKIVSGAASSKRIKPRYRQLLQTVKI